MDWSSFYFGVTVGAVPWAVIDLTILGILWPLRKFVALLRDPRAMSKLRFLLNLED